MHVVPPLAAGSRRAVSLWRLRSRPVVFIETSSARNDLSSVLLVWAVTM